MTIRDHLMIYVYRKSTEIEQQKESLRLQRKTYSMDNFDIYENMLADMRCDCFNEFVNDIFNIIKNIK